MRGELVYPRGDYGPNNPGNYIGLAIHHSVYSTPLSTKEAALRIHQSHLGQGWSGYGYNFQGSETDNKIAYVGSIKTQRAHVYGRNHELIGLCLDGDYSVRKPPGVLVQRIIRFVVELQAWLGKPFVVDGHRGWALPSHPTLCPGNGWYENGVLILF